MGVRDGSRVDDRQPVADDLEHVPHFYLELDANQASELQFGRVPGEVREMARMLVDETFEDLRKNAAKPMRLAKGRR